MSYILDALRRADQERQSQGQELRPTMSTPAPADPPQAPHRRILLPSLVAALAVAIAITAWLTRDHAPTATVPQRYAGTTASR